MLRSMTGQGQARFEGPLGTLTIELRTVNNRHFKLSPRWSDGLSCLEARAESWIRAKIVRGTVSLNISLHRPGKSDYQINVPTLTAYYHQLCQAQKLLCPSGSIDFTSLAALPGVITAAEDDSPDADVLWDYVRPVLSTAIDKLAAMRAEEGEMMGRRLREDLQAIHERLGRIQTRSPQIVSSYRDRLKARVEGALSDLGLKIENGDLLREVQLFADRCDISEEVTRLTSHLEMFAAALIAEEAAGRKLDFVIQEMFREVNTIGSKANDAEVAGYVVEIKCAIERMRELVQNLE